MPAVAYENIEFSIEKKVAKITLNCPSVGNALSAALMRELTDAAHRIDANPEVWAVVIGGRGKHFSTGADLRDSTLLHRSHGSLTAARQAVRVGHQMIEAVLNLRAITIAALQGMAVGGGAGLVCACDFRIAEQSSQIYIPEVQRGMNLSWGLLPVLTAQLGPSLAKELIILCRPVPASRLAANGFFYQIVPDGGLEQAVGELLQVILDQPPVQAQMVKASVNAAAFGLARALSHMDADQAILTQMSEDFSEAINAFREKRRPRFKGN